jgi:hypothetical protein
MQHLIASKIDEKIRGLVLILNARGIPTTGSCEGHIDHGSPAPWVKITPPGGEKNSRNHRKPKVVEGHFREKVLRYLDELYKHRHVPRDVRIVIDHARAGFWIHNGGNSYSLWRHFVNESAIKIRMGKKVRSYIGAEERARRSKKLPRYQAEMKAFTEFLRGGIRQKRP